MATSSHPRRASNRQHSSLSAAREGWHRWARRHWGWFVPVLAVIGLGKGTVRAVRVTPRILRRFDRIGTGLDRIAVAVLSRYSRTQPLAAWLRRHSRQPATGMRCAYCQAQLTPANAQAHVDAHNTQAAAQAGQQPNVVPIRRPPGSRPSPRPRPAGTVPPPRPDTSVVEMRTVWVDPDDSWPRPRATTAASPAAGPSTRTGGTTMTTGAQSTSETQQLTRAAAAIGEMDPQTAWELDAQLQGLSKGFFDLSTGLGDWIENLDAIRTDPRVTAQAGIAVGEVAEVVRTLAVTRQLFRNLYAAQFAAAEAGVRQVQRNNFFNPNAA